MDFAKFKSLDTQEAFIAFENAKQGQADAIAAEAELREKIAAKEVQLQESRNAIAELQSKIAELTPKAN